MEIILPHNYNVDIRDSKTSTWRDVVYAALKTLNGKCSLDELYAEIGGHKKTEANPHWKEKIRQVLQSYKMFNSPERGVWQLS